MKILALEFSSTHRSVALIDAPPPGAPRVVGAAVASAGQHTQAFRLIESALREATWEREQIECIAVGLGPGSYTGIRTAIAIAQGWQLARNVKLLGISSVACLAAQIWEEGANERFSVIVDAQRGEFYRATYVRAVDGPQEVEALGIVSNADIQTALRAGEVVVGPEATRWFPASRDLFPNARWLGRQAAEKTDYVSGEKLEPIYLRETRFVKAPPPRF